MLTFPKSRIDLFRKVHPELRYGQEFHQFFNLNKCLQDKILCDKIYEAKTYIDLARLIHDHIDYLN